MVPLSTLPAKDAAAIAPGAEAMLIVVIVGLMYSGGSVSVKAHSKPVVALVPVLVLAMTRVKVIVSPADPVVGFAVFVTVTTGSATCTRTRAEVICNSVAIAFWKRNRPRLSRFVPALLPALLVTTTWSSSV